MFGNKKTVLFITKSKLRISKVTIGSKSKETIIAEFDWEKQDLANFLLKSSKAIGNTIRLVLSEDFVYVIILSLGNNEIPNRNIIRQKAQEFIPEDISKTVWEYKEVSSTSPALSKKIQAVVAVKKLFEDLSRSLGKSGLYVEQIEPLSLSLSRLTKKEEKPMLFVYIYDKAFLALSQKGAVFATERLDLPITKDKLDKFIAFVKTQFEITPEKIIFCGDTKNLNVKEYETEGIKTEIQDLSPTISLAYKKSVKETDQKELNLQSVFPTKRQRFTILSIGVISLIIIIILEIFLYFV